MKELAMPKRALSVGTMIAALALLSACVNLGGKAPKFLAGLTAASAPAAGPMAGGPIADALVVLDPQTDRRLDVQRIAVQVSDTEIAYLKDATWVERPARLFRHLLAETIRAKSTRLVFEANDDESGAKASLAGRLIDMGYDARSHSAVVRYDALRADAKGAIRAQRFEAVVPGVSAKPEAVAAALNRAANQVAAQVADWVG
jgi:cholesterol transport system auxiliary component